MPDDRELGPEQDERIRRLLAEARVDEPMPGDVALRLDRVIAQLGGGGAGAHDAEVVELAARRRRRVTTLLAAAVAVVAVGVGAQVLGSDDLEPSAGDASSATAPEPTADELLESGAAGAAEQSAPAPEPPAMAQGPAAASALRDVGDARIRAAYFAIDVERVRANVVDYSADTPTPTQGGGAADSTEASRMDLCEPGAWGPGQLYLVRYAGNPAVLAFRPAVGETQVVDLLQCGTADILRSVTLPGS